MTKISNLLKGNKICVFLIPDRKYASLLRSIVSGSSKHYERICYISLNKPYKTMKSEFEKHKIDTKGLFFIDASPEKVGENEQVVSISSPKAMTELSITMGKIIELGKINFVVLDSLSTLLMYSDAFTVVKFVHSNASRFRSQKLGCAFICIKDKSSEGLVKDLTMFVDDVVKLG